MTIADSLPPQLHHDASVLDVADGLARVMGDRALFARMLRRFAADYGAGVTPIAGALASGDLRLAHRLAHTLKGAAGMISAHALHHHAGLLELALRKGDRAAAAELDAVGAALAALLPTIDRLLGGKAVQAVPAAAAALPSDHLLVAQLAELLANGDGAAVDLLEQSGTALAAALGHARFCEVALAANEFDFEGALETLRQGNGAGTAGG
ncbi:phosphotransfer domain-containing protein [Massilia eurypsychrophila]|uniref:Phosphotransfer domain-containing protein n=1 Tax=Massilia eurypsychrophila TaxID=1485217 RepID=A0A2G8TKM8_9BURK|nr:Hpt domain-containing protein [Massilia eurypsychrophila]PIL46597.1 phosphotransfer domain-containing protein [Massilia eurypsychrophila]